MVSPFGPGALLVAPDGTSMVAAGLDHWFDRDGDGLDSRFVDDEEFRVEEWRLQRRMGVDHFRLPPDYRRRRKGQQVPNVGLTVPFLRFPQWHFCPWCKRLSHLPLTAFGRQKCQACHLERKKTSFLAQVPFVAMCDGGHLQDFPWREWVHRSATPACQGTLSLYATGGATLANQIIKCSCGVKARSLSQIVEAAPDGSKSFLSTNLESRREYLCQGRSPQHGSDEARGCNRPLRGSLRSASNLYFGIVRSAIYLPRSSGGVPDELLALLLEEPDLIDRITQYFDAGRAIEPGKLRKGYNKALRAYSDAELEQAAKAAYAVIDESKELPEDHGDAEETEEEFRRAEARVLRSATDSAELTVVPVRMGDYTGITSSVFASINLVERLRETRVLAGFNRVLPDQSADHDKRMNQLWASRPARDMSWLPGFLVFGEGLFLRLDERKVRAWERVPTVQARINVLRQLYEAAQATRQLRPRELTAPFLLVHTLAHVLMNQLTFECGYSSAALRERLYVSSETGQEDAAVLIYTAAGDAEGTMGGLVRMGKPGYLEGVLDTALRGASWCAADPVCMEIGSATGQGPDSCNLAACHSCGLVPETACEEFNRFLDRGMLVGTMEQPEIGFFRHHGWKY
jgi:hypothetical protein